MTKSKEEEDIISVEVGFVEEKLIQSYGLSWLNMHPGKASGNCDELWDFSTTFQIYNRHRKKCGIEDMN